MKGTIYLIPVPLGEDVSPVQCLPASTLDKLRTLKHFVAENPKTARHFLKAAGTVHALQEIQIISFGKHDRNEMTTGEALRFAREGHDMGIVSEAGCPGIADPGAELVNAAHKEGFRVVPMTGPSSILLALMASGMNGQQFRFHGYLPIDASDRMRTLRQMEQEISRGVTQVFIETPFRNRNMLEFLLGSASPQTQLCVCADLTTPKEKIFCHTIAQWKKLKMPDIHKIPAVYVLGRS